MKSRPSRRNDFNPMRTCIGCRQTISKRRLLRFVGDARGHLKFDAKQDASGRGIYLCPKTSCFVEAAQQGNFRRGLRRNVASLPAPQLLEMVRREIRDQLDCVSNMARQDGRSSMIDGFIQVMEPRLRAKMTILGEQMRSIEMASGSPIEDNYRE